MAIKSSKMRFAYSGAVGARTYLYGQFARLAGWDRPMRGNGPAARQSLGLLAWRAGVAMVLLSVPMAMTHNWDREAGSETVHVLANLVWLGWAFTALVFVVALLLTGFQWLRLTTFGSKAGRIRQADLEPDLRRRLHELPDQMINWRRVPWSLWAYVALTTGGLVRVLTITAPVVALIMLVAVTLGLNFFLLRQLRWLWIATIVLSAVSVGIDLVTGNITWYGDVIGLVGMGLLLAPATRRFFDAAKPAVAT